MTSSPMDGDDIIIARRLCDFGYAVLLFNRKSCSVYWWSFGSYNHGWNIWDKLSFSCRHFIHVTKSHIFKNLSFRQKSRSQHSRQLAEKPFQAPKIIFTSPKLVVQKWLSYAHLLKDKRFKFTFLGEPTFQVLVRGSSPPKNI